jgi:hypothetical protein
MRRGTATILGSLAILAVLETAVLAKSPGAQKGDDKPSSSSCSAYEQQPDGTWTALPCREIGSGGQGHQRSTTRSGDQDSR